MTIKPKYPTAPKALAVLKALQRGEYLTVGIALGKYGVYALSQECGRLRRLGWQIDGQMIPARRGTHVKRYRMGV